MKRRNKPPKTGRKRALKTRLCGVKEWKDDDFCRIRINGSLAEIESSIGMLIEKDTGRHAPTGGNCPNCHG